MPETSPHPPHPWPWPKPQSPSMPPLLPSISIIGCPSTPTSRSGQPPSLPTPCQPHPQSTTLAYRPPLHIDEAITILEIHQRSRHQIFPHIPPLEPPHLWPPTQPHCPLFHQAPLRLNDRDHAIGNPLQPPPPPFPPPSLCCRATLQHCANAHGFPLAPHHHLLHCVSSPVSSHRSNHEDCPFTTIVPCHNRDIVVSSPLVNHPQLCHACAMPVLMVVSSGLLLPVSCQFCVDSTSELSSLLWFDDLEEAPSTTRMRNIPSFYA